MNKKPAHNFHIPVMGLAYTIDSPIRVAQFGISSVVSIIDDEIIERMRDFYSKKFNFDYTAISIKSEDHRAERITAYLDMMDDIVTKKFKNFKEEISKNTESLKQFIGMLPSTSGLKDGLQNILNKRDNLTESIKNFIDHNFNPGEIDVNIMTKVDKDNFIKNVQLPTIYNDAHASLRGFANSKLSSSVIFSAGMNPRLYSYLEEFEDFFPNQSGELKKKIILKVSDFRSAMIQGNFLAKKGLWVSEYRIESGLNCGGHAFATDGLLMGPIMEEFKQKKNELQTSAFTLWKSALEQKGKMTTSEPLEIKISVQGGVGTSEEHDFLLSNYNADSVGWGSPFLLVPEATSLDQETRNLLTKAKEEDYYLSNMSPLGVPFNTIRGTSNDEIKDFNISNQKFGSSCPKKFLALSKEFTPKGTCTASKKYQDIKLNELETNKLNFTDKQYEKNKKNITDKSCLCVGLANSAYLELEMPIKGEKQGVVVCPGPNLSFFDKEVSLSEMVRHIYGYENVLQDDRRPHLFINELKLYVDYFKNEIVEFSDEITKSDVKKWESFKGNLLKGIAYYEELFAETNHFKPKLDSIFSDLKSFKLKLEKIKIPQL
ncbi:hypothetical protein NG800_009180 [Epilithonimonas ginsengisoli]|uniref:Uncharacterized protein n=1 Tax=Epilithonimonas ginsengisoli TaxID=1245592 RepID=A0ABU4JHI8_9FLAO|nr:MULTISPECIES: hypothetical protein [Chryseobacterium group]MBV6880581.1 hypothetical protein [Epilithonimonas sp. FP105]MDW8549084.1 hypothetical protein [Epilithonimonas ginsengisoli]OAH72830.1 hypothetical protein AXA65_09070 [Chryseobacterium sp. FP211-J200]